MDPVKPASNAENELKQARRKLEESLGRTRATMARQKLLKRLWRLNAKKNSPNA